MISTKNRTKFKIGRFKKVNMYRANVECPDEEAKYFIELGKKVATDEQYFDIGAVYAIQQSLKEVK